VVGWLGDGLSWRSRRSRFSRCFRSPSGGWPWGPDPLTTAAMMQDVLALRGSTLSNPDPGCAGPAISMVSGSCTAYLVLPGCANKLKLRPGPTRSLGFKLEEIALFIQRSWPVVSEEGMVVGRHHHPNAHLSAVFYLNGDGSGRAVRCACSPHAS